MATYNVLRLLAGSLSEETYDSRVLMRGVPHNVTTEMDLALWSAARAIGEDAHSAEWFTREDAATLAADFSARRLPKQAEGTLSAFLERYGARGLGEIDLGRPRWREDPVPVIQTLRSYLQFGDTDLSPDAAYARGRAVAEAEVERLVTALRRSPGGWFKAPLARWAAHRMRALIGLRESPKFAIVRLLDMARGALLVDGRDLVSEGVLDRPDDVFFLHLAELAASDKDSRREWRAAVRTRRHAYERESHRVRIPRLLLSNGTAFYTGVTSTDGAQSGSTDGALVLAGSPVSPGIAEGIARVAFDPRSAHLSPGDILVCRGTDPSWTPLFLLASGLVTEVGGMMTHGSVVAREYGIPAVVGVHDATQRIRDGQRIRVDGSRGRVLVVRDDPGELARGGPVS
jgi:pyruvate,water dikinase